MARAASFRPLFLCPGGWVAGAGAAIPLALFLDAKKMMLGAFWTHFRPLEGRFTMSAGELVFGPFLALSGDLTHANKASLPSFDRSPKRGLFRRPIKRYSTRVQSILNERLMAEKQRW